MASPWCLLREYLISDRTITSGLQSYYISEEKYDSSQSDAFDIYSNFADEDFMYRKYDPFIKHSHLTVGCIG